MIDVETLARYHFDSADPPHTARYVTPCIMKWCRRLGAKRILDLGCGNGALCAALSRTGADVVGCDPSATGIAVAQRTYPHIPFRPLSVYDDPAELDAGPFDVVVSTEVIEHLFNPRALPRFASRVLRPEGHLILSTPYHGYLKNLALSLAGGWDRHCSPLWDGGHIKFWSRATLRQLVTAEGFEFVRFIGTGRVPYLWKSMVVIFRKPQRL
jgi:2-polyprenyl-3-methyl-5-hydroxy-6-metoxy-1,4-benzoquinol methylase